MFFFEARVISVHIWLFPGQSSPFPTNDPRFPGCGRRASRQEDEGAARGRNGFHLSTDPSMGRSPGCPEPSLRTPGTQFQIQAHAFQLQGIRGPQDVGGGDDRSDQHHWSSPPTPPSQKPAHHRPSPTQRTGPGRRYLEGKGARRECGGPPCPPRLSACDQGARAPWAASPSLCKPPILTASPHLRNLRDPPGASTTAVQRPCRHVVWHRMGGRKDQGPEGRRRLGRTCGHEKRVGGQGGGKGQLEMDSLLEAGTESPHANWGGRWSPPQALAGTPRTSRLD